MLQASRYFTPNALPECWRQTRFTSGTSKKTPLFVELLLKGFTLHNRAVFRIRLYIQEAHHIRRGCFDSASEQPGLPLALVVHAARR